MWYTKNLRIAQVNNALQNFKDLLKANEYIGLSDLVIGVDGYDPKDENKMFTFTLNNQQKAETNINKVKSKNLELNTAANSASNTNTTDNSKKIEIKRAPDDVPGNFNFLLDGDPIRIGDNLYKFKLGGEEYTGNFLQMNDILKNEFERIKSQQKISGDFQAVTENKGQKSQPGALVSPKHSDNKYGFNISTEDIDNYNKLVDNKFQFKVTAIPAENNPKGHTVKVEFSNPPSGTESLVNKLKQYIENKSIFTLPTDEKGDLIPMEYNITFDTKTEFTPAQFQKTFVTPTLINSRIGDPIKLKIDGRDIKNVRNGENVILDPNDLYLTKGQHIIEFVSNNADKNLNADKSDFLSYQVNVIDGQKLSLIGSSRGSFPQLYNRGPLSTEKQRIEQRLKAQRKAPTQEAEEQTDKLDTALRAEASSFGLKNSVYNTAMQRYDFNEVEQYVEEIMRNRALYSTPQKRKEYAESLKRERGRVRTQTPADALLNPRPGA
jgi:hypothetical protein